jgi:hypothetical protein
LQKLATDIQGASQDVIISFAVNGYLAIATRHDIFRDLDKIVIWDTNSVREIQRLGLLGEENPSEECCDISLNESGAIAMSTKRRVFIGSVNQGAWLRIYDLSQRVPNINFDLGYNSRLDTGSGVLEIDLEEDADTSKMPLKLKPCWDPLQMRVSSTASDAWLMKDSRRVLRIPRQSVDTDRFSIQTKLESGISTVVLVHDDCLFLIRHQDQ